GSDGLAGRDDLAVIGGAGVGVGRHGKGATGVLRADAGSYDAASAERRIENTAGEKAAVFQSFEAGAERQLVSSHEMLPGRGAGQRDQPQVIGKIQAS